MYSQNLYLLLFWVSTYMKKSNSYLNKFSRYKGFKNPVIWLVESLQSMHRHTWQGSLQKLNHSAASIRPWHDARTIAHARVITCANQEKGGLGRRWKACPKVKLCGLISSVQNSKWLLQNYFNWFNRINFKLILPKFYFLKHFLTIATFCYLIYFQSSRNVAFVNMFYQKR